MHLTKLLYYFHTLFNILISVFLSILPIDIFSLSANRAPRVTIRHVGEICSKKTITINVRL